MSRLVSDTCEAEEESGVWKIRKRQANRKRLKSQARCALRRSAGLSSVGTRMQWLANRDRNSAEESKAQQDRPIMV